MLALRHKDDLEGGFLAWEWAAKFHLDWSPAHPADYAFLTKAVACFHANPTKGTLRLPVQIAKHGHKVYKEAGYSARGLLSA